MQATTEKIAKTNVSFGLPSAPALFLSLARSAHECRSLVDLKSVFTKKLEGIWPDDHKPLFGYFEDFAAEVIFSFTALEAFVNEVIPIGYQYSFVAKKKLPPEILDKSEIERRVSLDEKLKKVLPDALKTKSPSGTKAWQDFKELKEVRDRLIHLKSGDRKSSGPEFQTLWGLMLEKDKIIYHDTAVNMIAAFPTASNGRRWFSLCGLINKKI